MNSHNAKPAFAFHKTPLVTDEGRRMAGTIRSKLVADAKLAVADDPDAGCDPYNSTGSHVVLKAK